jgi:hypothetical protein
MKLMLIITYIFIYMAFAAIIRMILDFDMYDKPVLELVCTILWPLFIVYAVFYITLIHPIGEIIKRNKEKHNEHEKR